MARKKWWAKNKPGDPFQSIQVNLPRGMFDKIKLLSGKKQMPSSRLIAWALYNAMTKLEKPFEIEVKIPHYRDYVVDSHIDQASKLFKFLAGFPAGLPLDVLVMFADEIGIHPSEVGYAYFQLKLDGVIIEEYPSTSHFPYHPDYRYIKVRGIDSRTLKKVQLRTVAGVSTKKYTEHQREGILSDLDAGTETIEEVKKRQAHYDREGSDGTS